MDEMKEVKSCRICGNEELVTIADFGNVPLANSLVFLEFTGVSEYPIKLLFCPSCSLIQLSIVVNPKILYGDYKYHSSVSRTFREHCAGMALEIRSMMGTDNKLVVDIASNDGCLLQEFKKVGFDVLGVEPSTDLCHDATVNGIRTLHDFWGGHIYIDGSKTLYDFWGGYINVGRKANCITATNVFAHVDNLSNFLLGVKNNLEEDGLFIIEVPWAINMILDNQYDTIYHEHLSYFLLKPIIQKLAQFGLTVFNVNEVAIHGGSLRVYATNSGNVKIRENVQLMLDYEKMHKMYDISTYSSFRDNVEMSKDILIHTLQSLKDKKVAGYCASAKGISLLNYCEIDVNLVKMIADETIEKQGRYIPIARIPIVSIDKLKEYDPDYLILFSWNFIPELKEKTSWFKGKYIIPIPYARFE